jgi:hypothetical protein
VRRTHRGNLGPTDHDLPERSHHRVVVPDALSDLEAFCQSIAIVFD